MTRIAVSALGRDRPGIVAGVTGVLLQHGLNLADSQMGILSGRFSMTLLVEDGSGGGAVDADALRRDLQAVGDELELDAIFATPVAGPGGSQDGVPDEPAAGATLMVTVYGADHPGIVNAVARELSERAVNIVDLETRQTAGLGAGPPLYAMFLEVVLPAAMREAELADALRRIGAQQHVEISVRVLEADVL